MLAEFLRQRAGIDAIDAGDMFLLEPVAEAALRVPVAIFAAIIADDDSFGMNLLAFHEGREAVRLEGARRDTVVANQRVSQDHQLSGVGRVGQALRIARHCGIENHFAGHRLLITERIPSERRPVVED